MFQRSFHLQHVRDRAYAKAWQIAHARPPKTSETQEPLARVVAQPNTDESPSQHSPPNIDTPHSNPAAWGDIYWKPFEIGIGALYALCLKGGFDSTILYFRKNPLELSSLDFHIGHYDRQLAITSQLVTYVLWVSAYYFYTVRLYFRLPAEPERHRVIGFANITVTLALFYFLGESIGQPSKSQVVLICAILVADVVLPIQALRPVANKKMRIWWISAALMVLVGAIMLLAFVPSEVMTHYWWSYLILGLITANYFVVRPIASKCGFLPK